MILLIITMSIQLSIYSLCTTVYIFLLDRATIQTVSLDIKKLQICVHTYIQVKFIANRYIKVAYTLNNTHTTCS